MIKSFKINIIFTLHGVMCALNGGKKMRYIKWFCISATLMMISGFCNTVSAFDYDTYEGEYYEFDGYRYAYNEDGTVFITDYHPEEILENDCIEIPETLDGYPVTGIDKFFLDSCIVDEQNINKIILPESINEIKYRKAANIALGNGLTTIEVDDRNQYYTDVDGVLYNKECTAIVCYPTEKDLSCYEILEGCEVIEAYAFKYCENLNEIIIPDSMGTIEERAFIGTPLEEIMIPENVENIYPGIFLDCCDLEYIHVAADNDTYAEIDGVLFNKKKKSLCSYPRGKRDEIYNIPEGIQEIEAWAFSLNEYLKDITLPEGVRIIGDSAFQKLYYLEKLNLPESLEYIGQYALWNDNIRYFYIPQNVQYIENDAICGWMLENIEVDPDNPYYKSVEGGLVNLKNSSFMFYAGQKSDLTEYQIPEGVTFIENNAVWNSYIKKLVIPEGVTAIAYNGITGCEALEEIWLPSSLESMPNEGHYYDAVFVVERRSYAAEWAREKGENYRYTDSDDWLDE